MKPLNILIIFLCIVTPLLGLQVVMEENHKLKSRVSKQYHDGFRNALDDSAFFLGLMEDQHERSGIRYQKEKRIETDRDVVNAFYDNLAFKWGIENDPVAIQNLKLHTPAIVIVHYEGYTMVGMEDLDVGGRKELTPVSMPRKTFNYKLDNGNLLYFTLDNFIRVYDRTNNYFYEGLYEDVVAQTNLSPLTTRAKFDEVRVATITRQIEDDMSKMVNKHMGVVKKMDLNIQFDIPKGIDQQSINDIGLLVFIQGFPMISGEKFSAFSFGTGSVVGRKYFVGGRLASGRLVAYEETCVPAGFEKIEGFRDATQAARKGYFVRYCNPF